MPKGKRGGQAVFQVSAWQIQREGRPTKADEHAEAGYSEVELPLVVGGCAESDLAPAGGPSDSHAMAIDPVCGAAPQPSAAQAAAAAAVAATAAPSSAAPASGGGWIAKRRRAADNADGGLGSEAVAADGGESVDGGEPLSCRRGGIQPASADEHRSPSPQPEEQPLVELQGTAYLALLPNGSVTGHLVCAPSALGPRRRRSFGLMGEVVVAGRECTRDEDWGVLRMTLVGFGGGGGEVSFLVERTEGDAMCLRAPVPWQGVELEALPALDAACTCGSASGLALAFRCRQLLSGGAGDDVLRRLQPSLAGRGAMLNVGQMRLGLPPEAAALVLGNSAPAARSGPAPAGGLTPAAGAEASMRRVTMGRSSGGGRVVRDSDDDW